MREYQDTIALDGAFPFQINEVLLRAEDNTDDIFHWHNYYEITRVLEGGGCYYANGQAFEVTSGDIIIFNSDEIHGWQVFQNSMLVLAMIFDAQLVAGYGELSDTEYLRPFIERGSSFVNRVGAQEPCAQEIGAIMAQIDDEWHKRHTGYTLMIKADVLRILTILLRHYHDPERAAGAHGDRNKALMRLQHAFEYIDSGYCGKVSLKEAANRVYMSPNYFSHYFHTATGISFSEYVTMRRMRKARRLLETTGRSIYEIAMECGFPNSSNFYRLYKKHTGETPRQNR